MTQHARIPASIAFFYASPTEPPPAVDQQKPRAERSPRCTASRQQFLHPDKIERQGRRAEWHKAESRYEYAKALLHLNYVTFIYERDVVGDSRKAEVIWFERDALNSLKKRTEAALILTPAPGQTELTWKRKTLAKGRAAYLPLSNEAVAAILRADEAWVTAYTTSGRPRRTMTPDLKLVG